MQCLAGLGAAWRLRSAADVAEEEPNALLLASSGERLIMDAKDGSGALEENTGG